MNDRKSEKGQVIDWIREGVCGERHIVNTHQGLTEIKIGTKLVKEEKTSFTKCVLYAPNLTMVEQVQNGFVI